ncbi:MAG: hypothetical protein MZV49_13160 [Rhodopseudomonas palustris]|nr:hypothetical protein [Rhodopseudomonas palustris]
MIIGQFTLAEQALSQPLDEQLKLRRRANTVQSSIDAGKKGVDAAIAYYDRRLGTDRCGARLESLERHPVHHVRAGRRGNRPASRDARSSRSGAPPTSRACSAYKFGGAGFAAAAGLARLAQPQDGARRSPSMQAAAQVLRRPISAWLRAHPDRRAVLRSRTRRSCCTRWRCCWRWFRCCACCRSGCSRCSAAGRTSRHGPVPAVSAEHPAARPTAVLPSVHCSASTLLTAAAARLAARVVEAPARSGAGAPAPPRRSSACSRGPRWQRCWRRSSRTSSATSRSPRC